MFLVLVMCGCVTKQTTYDRSGAIEEEKYVIKRPLKKFVETVEFE